MKEYFKKKDILTKINQGDEDTFIKMYNFYAPKLFLHAYYRVSSKETAEDIAQQVFYKTWKYLSSSENRIDNLNAFLYKTINNLITDYYRKAERKNVFIDENLESKLSIDPSYTDEIDQDLDIKKIKDAASRLKPQQQELITLRYLDDLSVTEISKISGKSKNAIYVGIHRALKELKQITS